MSKDTSILSDLAPNVTTSTTTASPAVATPTTIKLNFMAPPQQMSAPMDPLSHVGDGIFLQTKTAQGLAGIFVWAALFITCQQVRKSSNDYYAQLSILFIVILR